MKLLKVLFIAFGLLNFSVILAQEIRTSLWYCCPPSGPCVGQGFENQNDCRQACAGGDMAYRCEARAATVSQFGISPTSSTGGAIFGAASAIQGALMPTTVGTVAGTVVGATTQGIPAVSPYQ